MKTLLVLLLGLCLSSCLKIYPEKSIFKIEGATGSGTAFAVKTQSHKTVLITNYHVCSNGQMKINDIVLDKPIKEAKVYDICVYAVPKNLEVIPLIMSDLQPMQHEEIFTYGFPNGQPMVFQKGHYGGFTKLPMQSEVTKENKCNGGSIISTPFFDVCTEYNDAINTSLHAAGGQSGSPILNSANKVVGVLFAGDGVYAYIKPLIQLRIVLKDIK